MQREKVVELARITKNDKSFLRKYDLINKVNLFNKMKQKFDYVFILYVLTFLSLFTRMKPITLALTIISLFATLFIGIALLVNKYNKKELIKQINETGIEFYLDDKENFENFIYNPVGFIDEHFLEIESEYLHMALLYFNTKLTIEPDNNLYLVYMKKLSKRVEEIEKKEIERKIILNKISKTNGDVVSHIDIQECDLTEEEKNEIKIIHEKESKLDILAASYKESKKWYNSLGIGKKL